MTNQPNEIWLSWEDSAGYGYWDTRDEAELNSAEDFHPVRFVPAASEAGAVPVYYRYRHSANEKWHYGPTPQSWWECKALYAAPPAQPQEAGAVPVARIQGRHGIVFTDEGLDAKLPSGTLLYAAPAAQPEKQAGLTTSIDALHQEASWAAREWADNQAIFCGRPTEQEEEAFEEGYVVAMLKGAPPAPSQQAGADAARDCNGCAWSGPESDCVYCGSVGPLCPKCHETTELRDASAAPVLRTAKPGEIGLQEKRLPNGEYVLEAAPAAQGDERAEEDRIDALRLKAFRTNDPDDRRKYFEATSKWFQDRYYRALSRQPSAPAKCKAGLYADCGNDFGCVGCPEPSAPASAILHQALERMDRARSILTDGKPRPECNWGVLATEDLRAALAAAKPEGGE